MSWTERNGRVYLKDVLPLETPFSIIVELTRACNFKCIYCVHSTENVKQNTYKPLSLELFKKFINDAKQFPNKLKTLHFCGLGEPLLNKDLPKMIELAKEITDETVLITNGSLLMPKKSDELINSGLDVLRISLQGQSAEEYYKNCGVKIDFENFISNIKYFYENKKQSKIILRMPDICLKSDEDYNKLNNIYSDICDGISIQNISPIQKGVDYSNIKKDYNEAVYKNRLIQEVNVCPQPFYLMQLAADGIVSPCCAVQKGIIGDINSESIYDIWHGKKMQNIRIAHLKNNRHKIQQCLNCNFPQYIDNEYDNIDDSASLLLNKYEKLKERK